MPHDHNGNIVNVGDTVMIPCRIKAIHLTEEYCNIDLDTQESMYPSVFPISLTLNSRQVVKPWRNDRGDLLVYLKEEPRGAASSRPPAQESEP